MFEGYCHATCAEIDRYYKGLAEKARRERPWHDRQQAERFAIETHHDYFRRLQDEEEARLHVMAGQSRALNKEKFSQMNEEARERNRRQDEADRREDERREADEREELRRSRE